MKYPRLIRRWNSVQLSTWDLWGDLFCRWSPSEMFTVALPARCERVGSRQTPVQFFSNCVCSFQIFFEGFTLLCLFRPQFLSCICVVGTNILGDENFHLRLTGWREVWSFLIKTMILLSFAGRRWWRPNGGCKDTGGMITSLSWCEQPDMLPQFFWVITS